MKAARARVDIPVGDVSSPVLTSHSYAEFSPTRVTGLSAPKRENRRGAGPSARTALHAQEDDGAALESASRRRGFDVRRVKPRVLVESDEEGEWADRSP